MLLLVYLTFFLIFICLFIWLLQVLVVACGVFCLHHGMQDLYLPDQESNPGSLPVDHQGSPYLTF